ncbi:MAG: protein kinase [Gammaproteobacteria bacterium]|nr:protein kinase [Gammaproteobacteria bacterium]
MGEEISYTGKTIGRYLLTERIGKGAVGAVYKGFDERLLRPVAIKISFPRMSEDPLHLTRIIREAQIIARLEHANIIPIYDVVDYQQSALIVMRLVKGKDLGQILQETGQAMDVSLAFKIMYQVMLGMGFAHSMGVVHFDLKPSNIFISESDEVFILDFGLSAMLELERMDQGKIHGTPLYMPPEQFGRAYLDARSDIYSLGLILYTLITGKHPFEGIKSLTKLLKLQAEQMPPEPVSINPSIPAEFSDCVMRALEKNPRKRYYSCKDFLHDLELALPEVAAEKAPKSESRWDPRIDVHIEAKLQVQGSAEVYLTKISNLSVNGASIYVSVQPRVGSKISLEFDVTEDNQKKVIACQSTVMWIDGIADNKRAEIGVSFDSLDDTEKQYLARYIRNLLLG